MEQLNLNNYLQRIKKKTKTKFTQRSQELADPYMQYIIWPEDPKQFDGQMRLFWIMVNNYLKNHTDKMLIILLEWVKSKDSLHAKQIIKLLNK